MTQEELSSKVVMLSQEPPLFPVSLKDNIAYGLPAGQFSYLYILYLIYM